jgi:hypothetical protein
MQDDALMLHGSPETVRQAAEQMAALGVDRVRLNAGWKVLAPGPEDVNRPQFDARDPASYPQSGWVALDQAVKETVRAGMQPLVEPAFFAPRWAVQRESAGDLWHRWRPSAREFGRFTEAVARRYNGNFTDPADPARKLPAVRLWGTWNEPNHRAFILPQWAPGPRHRGRRDRPWRPASPHIYRRMHNTAYNALKRVNRDNTVLIGGLSFDGGVGRGIYENVPPLRFVRELACVNRRMRRLRRRECRGFRPLRADGFSHHAWSVQAPPDARDPQRENVRLGDLDRLTRLLARLHRRGRTDRSWPIYITEYGYETNPPDTHRGVRPEQQAEWLSQATYLAWRRPQVQMFAQFLLKDLPPDYDFPPENAPAYWADFQSGLVGYDGTPKPALAAFKLPFWLERATSASGQDGVLAFGQVRPADGVEMVTIEVRGAGESWSAVSTQPATPAGGEYCEPFATDPHGFYTRFIPTAAGTFRAVWTRRDGGREYSFPITVNGNRRPVTITRLMR